MEVTRLNPSQRLARYAMKQGPKPFCQVATTRYKTGKLFKRLKCWKMILEKNGIDSEVKLEMKADRVNFSWFAVVGSLEAKRLIERNNTAMAVHVLCPNCQKGPCWLKQDVNDEGDIINLSEYLQERALDENFKKLPLNRQRFYLEQEARVFTGPNIHELEHLREGSWKKKEPISPCVQSKINLLLMNNACPHHSW